MARGNGSSLSVGHQKITVHPTRGLMDPAERKKTLDELLPKIAKRLRLSGPGDVRLAQVRGGREVDMLDGEHSRDIWGLIGH